MDSFEFNEMSEELSDDWFDGYDEIAIKENRKWLGLMKEFRKKYVKSVMTWNGERCLGSTGLDWPRRGLTCVGPE